MILKSTNNFSQHNVFMEDNCDLLSFGYNWAGQCGTGNINYQNSPKKIMNNPKVSEIVLGPNNSFLLENNGDLFGCGSNGNSELGFEMNTMEVNRFVKVATNVTKVVSSFAFTMIQKENGKIYFTGDGLNRLSKAFVDLEIDDVINFSCGVEHCLILKKNGEVWVFGNNLYGKLGFPKNVTKVDQPKMLLIDEEIVDICCGYHSSFILTKDGSSKTALKCFGYNETGMLGLGHKKNVYDIQSVAHFPNITSVHCGAYHTILRLDSGQIFSCGSNKYSQTGIDGGEDVTSFTNLENIVNVTTGFHHSLFRNNKGETFICGSGSSVLVGVDGNHLTNKLSKLNISVKLFQNNQLKKEWTPHNHHLFPKSFRTAVFCFLLVLTRLSKTLYFKNLALRIPKPIQKMIISLSF